MAISQSVILIRLAVYLLVFIQLAREGCCALDSGVRFRLKHRELFVNLNNGSLKLPTSTRIVASGLDSCKSLSVEYIFRNLANYTYQLAFSTRGVYRGSQTGTIAYISMSPGSFHQDRFVFFDYVEPAKFSEIRDSRQLSGIELFSLELRGLYSGVGHSDNVVEIYIVPRCSGLPINATFYYKQTPPSTLGMASEGHFESSYPFITLRNKGNRVVLIHTNKQDDNLGVVRLPTLEDANIRLVVPGINYIFGELRAPSGGYDAVPAVTEFIYDADHGSWAINGGSSPANIVNNDNYYSAVLKNELLSWSSPFYWYSNVKGSYVKQDFPDLPAQVISLEE